MLIISLLTILLLLSFFFFTWPMLKQQLRCIQQSGYQFEKYAALIKSQRKRTVMWVMLGSIALNMLLRGSPKTLQLLLQYYLIHIAVFTTLGSIFLRKAKDPGPVWDGRMIRLSAGLLLFFTALLIVMGLLFRNFWWELPFIIAFWNLFSNIWILLVSMLLAPIERRISSNRFSLAENYMEGIAQTRASLGRQPLVTVGVAGSFGKSNFIHLAAQVLGAKYNMLFSSPERAGSQGSAEALIRNRLSAEHDMLLLEIEARHPGDVARLCKNVSLDFGVLTGIAERNLGTFQTMDNIAQALMEMAGGLKTKDSVLLLNYEDEFLRKQKIGDCSLLRYGIYEGSGMPSHLDVWASGVKSGPQGSDFTLNLRGQPVQACRIPLPGEYNLLHSVGAAGLALRLGLSMDELTKALAALQPREGYLRLLPANEWTEAFRESPARGRHMERWQPDWPQGMTVLDDSRQGGLEGARDSLNVLRDCAGTRLLLTPGLRSQGEQEEEYNRRLGRHASRCCDKMVIIGKDALDAIIDGANRAAFPADDVFPALDIRDALEKAGRLSREAAEADKPVFLLVLGLY